jgi:glucokinase
MMPVYMADYSIGVDLGGTNFRAAAVDRGGKILERISGATNFAGGRDAVLGDIVAAIGALRERHGTETLAGIGVGVAGFIRIREGFITNANNLPYLENFPVRDELARRLGTKVILENDANAAALGEKWVGAGKGVDDLVLLTLGTGVGGGIIWRVRLGTPRWCRAETRAVAATMAAWRSTPRPLPSPPWRA